MPAIVLVILIVAAASTPLTMWAISHWGGWQAFAKRFPSVPPAPDADRGFGSLSFSRLGGYNNCILWRADDDHLHLRVMVPFNTFHKPLSIPWAHIEIIKPKGEWGMTVIRIDGRRYGIPPRAAARELRVRAVMAGVPPARPVHE
jgi:hypothetical protein